MADTPSIESLIDAARSGDRTAYGQVLTIVATVVDAYLAMHITDDDERARETQATLEQVHAKLPTYRTHLPFAPWLFAVLRHRLAQFWHSRPRSERKAVAPISAERAVGAFEGALDQRLASLPAELAPIVRQIRLDRRSVKEAANAIGSDRAATLLRMRRGVDRIRKSGAHT